MACLASWSTRRIRSYSPLIWFSQVRTYPRNTGEINLLACHLVELRNVQLDSIFHLLQIAPVDLRVPVKKAGFIDEILHHEILVISGIGRDVADLFQRGD